MENNKQEVAINYCFLALDAQEKIFSVTMNDTVYLFSPKQFANLVMNINMIWIETLNKRSVNSVMEFVNQNSAAEITESVNNKKEDNQEKNTLHPAWEELLKNMRN